MRYSIFAGGKRLRPILTLAASEACGGTVGNALRPACAVEIMHTYSLVHDDLPCMDDDDLRRGRPTAHIVYGEANAVLIGDALLTLAFEWAAQSPQPARIVLELAQAAGHAGMVGGQVADLAAEQAEPNAETLDYIHRHKAGKLLTAALRMGAIAGNASNEQLDALTAFGEHLGLAFQIVDDILDETADEAVLGKPVGSDQEQGKMTYPALLGLDASKQLAQEHQDKALAALDRPDLHSDRLRELLHFVIERSF